MPPTLSEGPALLSAELVLIVVLSFLLVGSQLLNDLIKTTRRKDTGLFHLHTFDCVMQMKIQEPLLSSQHTFFQTMEDFLGITSMMWTAHSGTW